MKQEMKEIPAYLTTMTYEQLKEKFSCIYVDGIEKTLLSYNLNTIDYEKIKIFSGLILVFIERADTMVYQSDVKYEDCRLKERKRGGNQSMYWTMIGRFYHEKVKIYRLLLKTIQEDLPEKRKLVLDFIYKYFTDERDIQMKAYGWRVDMAYYQEREKAIDQILKN